MGIIDTAFGAARGAVGRVLDFANRLVGGQMQSTSPRYKRLDAYDRLYGGKQYEDKGLSAPWDKQPPGAPRVALKNQKPSVQYDLPRVIVDRPTALLFGEGKFPDLCFEPAGMSAASDEQKKALAEVAKHVSGWLTAVAEEGGLQAAALCWARHGATSGAGALTWSLLDGEFEFESHKAKYCTPTFDPLRRGRLVKLAKQYMFKKAIATERGEQEVDFWHREEWDAVAHRVYEDVRVAPSAPTWVVAQEMLHNFGFVPGVWVKNLDDGEPGNIDGVSLLDGLDDIAEDIDRTLSQKSRAVRYNQEPEKVYTGVPMDPANPGKLLAVGGGASTSLPKDADAKLLELKGDGQVVAEAHVVAQRGRMLEVARVVMPEPERLVAASKSGAALRILFAPLLELVGEMRQSYGRALQQLLKQILRAAQEGKLSEAGTLITAPPAELPDGRVTLKWGNYFDATPEDLKTLADMAAALKNAGVLDLETIVRALASHFGITDISGIIAKLEEQEAKDYGDLAKRPTKPGDPKPPADDPALPEG